MRFHYQGFCAQEDKRKPGQGDLHGNLNIFKNCKSGLISNIIERLPNSIRKLMGLYMAAGKRENPIRPSFSNGNESMKKT